MRKILIAVALFFVVFTLFMDDMGKKQREYSKPYWEEFWKVKKEGGTNFTEAELAQLERGEYNPSIFYKAQNKTFINYLVYVLLFLSSLASVAAYFMKKIKFEPKKRKENFEIAYYYKGNYDRAIEDYTAALKIKSDNQDALYYRGRAYYKKGDYDKAINDLETLLKISPNYDNAKQLLEEVRQKKQERSK